MIPSLCLCVALLTPTPTSDPLVVAIHYPTNVGIAHDRADAAVSRAERSPVNDGLDWAALRECESGGNYQTDTGNGYYGSYQFDLGTWASYGPPGNPAAAPPAEQDRRAQALYAARGASPWPVCGGLL